MVKFINKDNKTKKTTKCPSKNNNENGSNYETFTIEKNNQNQQYIIHKFKVNYQQKVDRLDSLHPYEFANKINKINIYYHNFWNAQLQSSTHNLYEYKVIKILVMQRYTIPSKKNDPNYLNITHH